MGVCGRGLDRFCSGTVQDDESDSASSSSSLKDAAAEFDQYAQFSHEVAFRDPATKSSKPKTGYYGIAHILLKEIYEPFFESERYDDKLKEEVLDKVLEQIVQIAQVLT